MEPATVLKVLTGQDLQAVAPEVSVNRPAGHWAHRVPLFDALPGLHGTHVFPDGAEPGLHVIAVAIVNRTK